MKRKARMIAVMVACLGGMGGLFGCGSSSSSSGIGSVTNSTTTSWTQQNPLDPNALQQFANALVEIPIAPQNQGDPTTYNVALRQGSWDFGLKNMEGNAMMDPATGKPVVTKTWGYEINGAFLGVYGATVEATKGTPLTFHYENDLRDEVNGVKGTGPYLTKHLLPVDPTLDGTNMGEPECRMVTHLHGGDVGPESDGHPNAWVANDPAVQANWVAAADPTNGFPGRIAGNALTPYTYPNTQEACTLWFHDHSMGITRLNAYAGVAAFYLIKDPVVESAGALANLPKGRYANPVVPSLVSDEFDLPIVIQDKSFNADGSLAFPAFTNLGTYTYSVLHDSAGNPVPSLRPEMFGNVITVNGKAWPYKNVKPQAYRLRLLNGSDSRTYNLWLQDADTGEEITPSVASAAAAAAGNPGLTWPVVQIAAEQGYADHAVDVAQGNEEEGLLIPPGARVDILIDFAHPVFKGRNIVVRNDCPAPFQGAFGPAAEDPTTLDPKTTGKIMMFKVANSSGVPSPLLAPAGPASSLRTAIVPYGSYPALTPTRAAGPRYLDFQERKDPTFAFLDPTTGQVAYRTQLLLNNMRFSDPITEKPQVNDVEEWVMINTTPDVHPMHVHLVKFEVIEKGYIDTVNFPEAYSRADGIRLPEIKDPAAFIASAAPGDQAGSATGNSLYTVAPNEKMVWKDIVMVPPAGTAFDAMTNVKYPGYVKIRAKFPRIGTYMWHCHILSHEENDMMRPFMVVASGGN
ncbi:multicopper oxidase family protein [Geomesophilobacter sediminis]|uniref:Multicopper oxidase domain-containing protein n=1 Tax=Geomesophilobacter sediminis TaxID=2798584 RepID=A0A8J7SA94_9BACT|nr:multicopper oxidase domain-containing protein [Geomesophilobacter sediminis]MBJ6727221.1 multicopper oxidase domain-containing protein [Geomesophilobacter sediminis]